MADEEQTAQVELEVAVGGEAEQEVTEEAKRSTSPSSSTSSEEGDKGEEQPAEPQSTQEQEPAAEPSQEPEQTPAEEPTEEPDKPGDEEPKTEEPPPAVEEPKTEEPPQAVEEPKTEEPPPAAEEPQTEEPPPAAEEPKTEEPPPAAEEPKTEEPPPAAEEPQTEEPPPAVEEPKTEEPPPAAEEPKTEEPPPAAEEPKTEEPPPAAAEEKPKEPEEEGERATVTVTVDVEGESEETPAGQAEQQAEGGEEPKPKPSEEERSPTPGQPILLGEYLRLMQVGTDLTKLRKSKTYGRVYRLEEDLLGVSWNSRSKKGNKARIPISQIKEVRAGRSTDSFKVHGDTYPEELCFSIIYLDGGKYKNLDLVALTTTDAKAWVDGLKILIKEEGSGHSRSKVRDRWLRDLFEEADKDGSGTLDVKEVLRMMNVLNVGISTKVLKKKFKEADADGNYDGTLDFEEFCTLFKELASRPEVNRLFHLYSSKKEWLTTGDLLKFLETEQGLDDPSPELASQLVSKYEPTDEGKAQGLMSVDGFAQFLLGPENDVFDQRHAAVYHDMTQPLSHYYIASSHNTYLLEDQLKGPSSVEAYIRALRKGCRCVELDCWDGDNGDPIVYHGHTLTSKIRFADVITAIKEHAFAVSPYPVILSIENHCSIPQQHKMAEFMEEILGDLLFKDPVDNSLSILPSPEQLKNKILVKGKKLKKELEEMDNDDGEVSDEDEAADIDSVELQKAGVASPTKEEQKPEEPTAEAPKKEEPQPEAPKEGEQKPEEPTAEAPKEGEQKPEEPTVEAPKEGEQQPEPAAEAPKEGEQKPEEPKVEAPKEGEQQPEPAAEAPKEGEGEKKEETAAEEKKPEEKPAGQDLLSPTKKSTRRRTLSFSRRQKRAAAPAQPSKKIKLSAKLSKTINYVQSVHFPGFDEWEKGKFYQMSSFGEASAQKHSTQSATKFMLYNKRQVSRIYPAGKRVDSSNYDPVPMWNCGCQIVALNYQTTGQSMDFNDGKFLQNGACGYLLKPQILREEISRYDHNHKHTIIPGVNPKVLTVKVISGQHLPKPQGGSKTGEVIDPYVVIQVAGIPEDRREEKTKAIDDNGFNPVWNETFQFIVRFPELALVRFRVMDKDWGPNRDDFIGQFTLPFESIVPGFRHIHLTSGGNKLENATLFVHIEIQDLIVEPTRAHPKGKGRGRKTREYPEPQLVGLSVIDEQFRAAHPHIRRAIDLWQDYVFGQLHFKDTCGRGPQALLRDCIEIVSARANGSKLSLFLDVIGEDATTQVYKLGVSTENAVIPGTLQAMIDAFNQLNLAIQALLTGSEQVASDLDAVYTEAHAHQDELKEHLQQIAATPKRTDQVFEHYAWTMCLIKSQANQLRSLKENAAANLKKIYAASQQYEIELKTSL